MRHPLLLSAGASSESVGDLGGIIWLFIQALILGLLAVFTPYIYTILPFTVGYLGQGAKTKSDKRLHAVYYACSIIIIFCVLGALFSMIVTKTGLQNYMDNWIVNLFLCRFIGVLGISFLGAITLKLPSSLINAAASRAKPGSIKGIFYMALTLPVASFSSTGPIIGLVLVLAVKVKFIGPLVGLLGFALGLGLPFVFPDMINIFVSSKSLLNNFKVVLGFFCLLLAVKFFSNGDVSLGWNILSRGIFIVIWMMLSVLMGIYMMGKMRLLHDMEPEQNVYGLEYVPLLRLFIAVASFTFALYLLPGLWGAPLNALSGFLPQ